MKVKLFQSAFITCVFLLSANFAFSQNWTDINEYSKIKLFESTRTDVMQMLGIQEYDDSGILIYKMENGAVFVAYSKGNCNKDDLTEWNIGKDVITEISYNFEETPKLKDLIKHFDLKLKPDVGCVPDHLYYVNEDNGTTVVYDKRLKKVEDISFEPSKKQKALYKCEQ